ncbi:ribonuclease Y [Spiroplasma taiwanense]|uniref:Ribonuclease Y n=1 Tax=Spiroplasma taiwanense CT-1 TaxID=1276220 RepID=S5MGI5_9MOLU|nr:ribonuclease Y [Spiroplasma taiwanense]AGR40965.1 hypothetical protein STAIW_v1c03050 [Spiroplasma taiwanense CT-1]
MLGTEFWENAFIVAVTLLIVIIVVLCTIILYLILSRQRNNILKKINDEGKRIQMKIIADAKAEAAILKLNLENEMKVKNESLLLLEKELKNKKDELYLEIDEINKKEQDFINEKVELNKLKKQFELGKKNIQILLEEISGMSFLEAKKELLDLVESRYLKDLSEELKKAEENLKYQSYKRASRILIDAMQKSVVEVTTDKNTTFFEIEDDSWKGKIIGKEGRNIKTFQLFCGVDIMIDDTPNRIWISSFNPIRREIAYLSLTELVKSGRIQPATIEEQILIQTEKLEKSFLEIGYKTVSDLKIYDLPEEIVYLLGKMKFRHSYGQNALQHSLEVARFSSYIAGQLNLDENIALKAGLLHDIGKAVDFEVEGTHVKLGVNILKKYNIDNLIINAVEAHHNDVEKESFYAEIVAIADTMSAARPGARNNDANEYFSRMKQLEDTCLGVEGVLKAYVLQSGRQIRVMVNPSIIDDYKLKKLAIILKQKISSINKTPGEIVITLIREKRESIKL